MIFVNRHRLIAIIISLIIAIIYLILFLFYSGKINDDNYTDYMNYFYIGFSPVPASFVGILIYLFIILIKVNKIDMTDSKIKKARKLIYIPISIIIGFVPIFISVFLIQEKHLNPSEFRIIFNYISLIINPLSDIFDFVVYVYLLGDFWKNYSIFRRCLRSMDPDRY